MLRYPVRRARVGHHDLPVRPDRLPEHGDTLQVGRFSVGVLHTPGHTDGSISFTLPTRSIIRPLPAG